MAPSRGAGGIVIFSGGSAANSLVDIFESIRRTRSCPLSYIIPISDNGGSTSELIRVFGGPGIGDVRSRLVRLIPTHPYSAEREAISRLLSHRLSGNDGRNARGEWSEIVDGTSTMWRGISSAKKELLRSFFNLVNLEILKRSRPPTSTFDFRSASIGNLFLTGARLFSGSFESAIYLLSAICGIPDEEVRVIPSINSNFSHHIAAELEDGSVIVGQNSISHPVSMLGKTRGGTVATTEDRRFIPTPNGEVVLGTKGDAEIEGLRLGETMEDEQLAQEEEEVEEQEDAHPPFTLPTLRTSNIAFTKDAGELAELPARINRLYYVNSFGQEILPPANPRAVHAVQSAQTIIYSIGSLFTSIVPNLVLRGMGEAMRRSHATAKILILNGCLDREVGPESGEKRFTAVDFIDALVKAGEQSRGIAWLARPHASTELETTDSETEMAGHRSIFSRPALQRAKSDGLMLTNKGYERTQLLPPPMLASAMPSRTPSPGTSPERSATAMPVTHNSSWSSSKPSSIYKHYVTHLIHLPNSDGTPYVDSELLSTQYGVKSVRVYGRRNENGLGMLYDPRALRGAIEAIIGARGNAHANSSESEDRPKTFERGRRNTVER
ncbi:hypothetical protein H2198_000710 [Neophaeococcomyces mojaviensis]|uniref:Uncharacterized protein n=1 Tax=Neophaeococcomyces mojaviensis TaxID=3383035 RepID=A0ACC3AJP1_9EURO|nr:hypothetical protein H2198_000710 [Knufia sp. JES_112]